jgi:signal transduction histidine kinase
LLQGDLEGKLEPEQAEDLESALTAAQRLSEMVSSLLDVSRLESGQMPLDKQPTELDPLLAGAIEALGGLTKGRTVSLIASASPVVAPCDKDVITRVVGNLVANALKFTPASGEVRVSATTEAGFAKVRVADTGPGIPPEYRERIFEKFGQVEGRTEGKKHSTGLGLTFCKLAAEAHGGSIGVDSVVGEGSTFWFKLPLE